MNPACEVNDRQLLRCWSVTKICSIMKCLCPMRSMQRKDRGSSPIAHQSLNCGILLKHARKMLGIASINRDSSHMNPIREVNDRQLLRCWSVTKICSMMKCLCPLRSMQRKERRWGRKTGFGRSSSSGPPLFNAIEFKKSPPSSYQLPLQFEQNRTIQRTFSASSISVFIPTYFVYIVG